MHIKRHPLRTEAKKWDCWVIGCACFCPSDLSHSSECCVLPSQLCTAHLQSPPPADRPAWGPKGPATPSLASCHHLKSLPSPASSPRTGGCFCTWAVVTHLLLPLPWAGRSPGGAKASSSYLCLGSQHSVVTQHIFHRLEEKCCNSEPPASILLP